MVCFIFHFMIVVLLFCFDQQGFGPYYLYTFISFIRIFHIFTFCISIFIFIFIFVFCIFLYLH